MIAADEEQTCRHQDDGVLVCFEVRGSRGSGLTLPLSGYVWLLPNAQQKGSCFKSWGSSGPGVCAAGEKRDRREMRESESERERERVSAREKDIARERERA